MRFFSHQCGVGTYVLHGFIYSSLLGRVNVTGGGKNDAKQKVRPNNVT